MPSFSCNVGKGSWRYKFGFQYSLGFHRNPSNPDLGFIPLTLVEESNITLTATDSHEDLQGSAAVVGDDASQQSSDKIFDDEEAPGNKITDNRTSEDEASSKEDTCYFLEISQEIRQMIYRHLLVSAEPIVGAEKLIGDQTAVLLRNYHPIPDIDATILRTCRAVYEEGVNILYRWNKFHFSDSRAIKIFKDTHLLSRSCLPPQIKYYGRLALLRSVSLKIAHPNGADMMNLNVRRAFIWGTWLTEFFSVEGRLNRYSSAYQVGFPALEKLRLDFTDWQLAADEGLRVAPFVAKLGESGGLQELVIIGIKHECTLEKLRDGLVKEGGIFHVVN